LASSQLFKKAALTGPLAGKYTATVVGPAGSTVDEPSQVADITEAITAGAKGIIVCDLDPLIYQKPEMAARAKGIVVVTIGCTDNAANYEIGENYTLFGEQAVLDIAKARGPDAQVAVVMSDLTMPNQVVMLGGFKAELKKYPKMKLVTILQDHSNIATAAQELEAMPGAYPSVNAVWMTEGNAAAAVPTAFAHAGLKPGKIYVLGLDTLAPTMAAVKEGWVTQTLAECYFWGSPLAVRLILAELAGNGPKQREWPVLDVVVGKAQAATFKGCPAYYGPSSL
jgi:ribose transport system substrate-binding protein